MDFGIVFANTGPFSQPDAAASFARAAEAAGFESLWTVEHVVVPKGYESTYPYDPSGRMPGGEDMAIPDPLIWLSYVAAATSAIRLATGILIVPQRNPVVLAKELATLDMMSGGRLELGIGVGWLEEEFDAIGVPFAGRGARTDEYVAAMRALWSDAGLTEVTMFARTVERTFADFEDYWSTVQLGPSVSATLAALSAEDTATLRMRLQLLLPTDSAGRIAYSARAFGVQGRVA